MLKQKRLKKQLGKGYRFEQKLSAEKVEYLLEKLEGSNHFRIAAALSVGAVKLEAVVYWNNGKYTLGYDLLVRSRCSVRSGSAMRICRTRYATVCGIWNGKCFRSLTGRYISSA